MRAVLLPTYPISMTPDQLVLLGSAQKHSVRHMRATTGGAGTAHSPSEAHEVIERAPTPSPLPATPTTSDRAPIHLHYQRQLPNVSVRCLAIALRLRTSAAMREGRG